MLKISSAKLLPQVKQRSEGHFLAQIACGCSKGTVWNITFLRMWGCDDCFTYIFSFFRFNCSVLLQCMCAFSSSFWLIRNRQYGHEEPTCVVTGAMLVHSTHFVENMVLEKSQTHSTQSNAIISMSVVVLTLPTNWYNNQLLHGCCCFLQLHSLNYKISEWCKKSGVLHHVHYLVSSLQ